MSLWVRLSERVPRLGVSCPLALSAALLGEGGSPEGESAPLPCGLGVSVVSGACGMGVTPLFLLGCCFCSCEGWN